MKDSYTAPELVLPPEIKIQEASNELAKLMVNADIMKIWVCFYYTQIKSIVTSCQAIHFALESQSPQFGSYRVCGSCLSCCGDLYPTPALPLERGGSRKSLPPLSKGRGPESPTFIRGGWGGRSTSKRSLADLCMGVW